MPAAALPAHHLKLPSLLSGGRCRHMNAAPGVLPHRSGSCEPPLRQHHYEGSAPGDHLSKPDECPALTPRTHHTGAIWCCDPAHDLARVHHLPARALDQPYCPPVPLSTACIGRDQRVIYSNILHRSRETRCQTCRTCLHGTSTKRTDRQGRCQI